MNCHHGTNHHTLQHDFPVAIIAVAHASLAGYLAFRDTPEVHQWQSGPVYKAVCKVNANEFWNAKHVAGHVVITESALDSQDDAIVFKPRDDRPNMFKFFNLYREAPSLSLPQTHFGE